MKLLSNTVKNRPKPQKNSVQPPKKIVEIILEIRNVSHVNQEIEIRIKIQQKLAKPPENRK